MCDVMFFIYEQVLVLLDMTPDQSMLDEGLAREVINRIQKARKKVSINASLARFCHKSIIIIILAGEAGAD